MIVLYLDIPTCMQSVPITTKVVSSIPARGARPSYAFGAPEFTPGFSGVRGI